MEIWHGGAGKLAAGGRAGFFDCCTQSAILLMKWSISRGKSLWRAILGNAGQDARCFRPVRFETLTPFH